MEPVAIGFRASTTKMASLLKDHSLLRRRLPISTASSQRGSVAKPDDARGSVWSGHAAFLDPDVNKALKEVLNEWGAFLKVGCYVEILGTEEGGEGVF